MPSALCALLFPTKRQIERRAGSWIRNPTSCPVSFFAPFFIVFEFLYHFKVLKNRVSASFGARGPERNAPEASAGLPLVLEDQNVIPPDGAGGIFPARSTRKPAPHDSNPASGGTAGPGTTLPLRKSLFLKGLRCYEFLKITPGHIPSLRTLRSADTVLRVCL